MTLRIWRNHRLRKTIIFILTDMKKSLFIILALVMGLSSAYAQQDDKKIAKEEAMAQKQKEKETK